MTRGGATECGIVCGGADARGHIYLLDDASLKGPPDVWGAAVVAAYQQHEANQVLGEANFGGDMVQAVVKAAAQHAGIVVPYRSVHASRGKLVRAEPVQALAAQGKIHHVGMFPQLEAELCRWVSGDPSPNRLDAYCWMCTALMAPVPVQRMP